MACLSEGKPKYTSILEYFQTFPVLKSSLGARLFEIDFEHLYPDKADSLFKAMLELRPTILHVAVNTMASLRDKEACSILRNTFDAITPDSNVDAMNAQCLLFLPFITDTPSQKTVRKESWKPSRTEVRNGFILQVLSSSNLISERLKKTEFALQKKRPILPYVLYVGNFTNPESIYVIVDDIMFERQTILDAVHLCFQIFFVCHTHYPEESNHIWLALQRGVYQIKTEHDRLHSPCKTLLTNLGLQAHI